MDVFFCSLLAVVLIVVVLVNCEIKVNAVLCFIFS